VLVTQGEHGMTLVPRAGEVIHVPGHPVKVRDFLRRRRHRRGGTGAGAGSGRRLGNGIGGWRNAARRRCRRQKGRGTVTPAELRRKILPHASLAAEEKIVVAGGDLDAHLADWRRQGLRVGFTNGCFDILHPGHVKVLTAAARRLRSADRRTEQRRPREAAEGRGASGQDARARAEVLAALEAVDLVAIFEGDTPIDLITQVKPSVLVKGSDYIREQVVGHEIVEACGGEVLLVDILSGFSTTSLVRRARESYPYRRT